VRNGTGRAAFYAPLKEPGHPVPSGDRLMARQLIACLERLGYAVEIASSLRAWRPEPDPAALDALRLAAEAEVRRITARWERAGTPDLWFSYHNYYKAPDLVGPALAARFGIPYVVAEGSYARKRDGNGWAAHQAAAVEGLRRADLHLCFTARDRDGLRAIAPDEHLAEFPPFIDVPPLAPRTAATSGPVRLITVGMARPGKKLENFRQLAGVLTRLRHLDWRLDAIGGGAGLDQARAAFASLGEDRVTFHGECPREVVLDLLARADLFVWPGFEEAYGLVYLEAQAMGVPVVARDEGGVASVMRPGVTGLLTPRDDEFAFAAAIADLIADTPRRRRMGEDAQRFARGERSLEAATARLGPLLERIRKVAP
jgi:glycosyltransferase involved in cell wall biosynthesis